jgi:hypothetical protein
VINIRSRFWPPNAQLVGRWTGVATCCSRSPCGDRHPIGVAVPLAEPGEDPPIGGLARLVEIESEDRLTPGIGVIHGASVDAERGTVGDTVAAVDAGAAEISIEPVERAAGTAFGPVHGPGPEAPCAIDLAIVEAVLRGFSLGMDER